jgi:hypothetical protein
VPKKLKPNCWASFFSAPFRAHNLGTNSGPHGCAENEVFNPSALNSKRFRYHIEPHADLVSCVFLRQVILYKVMIGRHAFYFDSCGEKAARDDIESHANSCFFCRLPQETLYDLSLRGFCFFNGVGAMFSSPVAVLLERWIRFLIQAGVHKNPLPY